MPNLILVRNTYQDLPSLNRVLHYVLRGVCVGGYGINPSYAYEQMALVKKSYYKTDGVQLKHFILSFEGGELLDLDFEDLMKIGFNIGKHFKEYQMVYGVHLDTKHAHIHFVMNTVSYVDGHKYADGLLPFRQLCGILQSWFPGYPVNLCHTESYSKENPYSKAKEGNYTIL